MTRANTNTNTTTTDVDVPTLTDVIVEQIAHDTGDAVGDAFAQCRIIDETDKVKADNNLVGGGIRLRLMVTVSTMTDDQKSKFQKLAVRDCSKTTSDFTGRICNPNNVGTDNLSRLDWAGNETVDDRLAYLPNIKGLDGKPITSFGAFANLIMPKSEGSKIRAIAKQVDKYNSMSTDDKAKVDAEIVKIKAKALSKESASQLQVALSPATFGVTGSYS